MTVISFHTRPYLAPASLTPRTGQVSPLPNLESRSTSPLLEKEILQQIQAPPEDGAAKLALVTGFLAKPEPYWEVVIENFFELLGQEDAYALLTIPPHSPWLGQKTLFVIRNFLERKPENFGFDLEQQRLASELLTRFAFCCDPTNYLKFWQEQVTIFETTGSEVAGKLAALLGSHFYELLTHEEINLPRPVQNFLFSQGELYQRGQLSFEIFERHYSQSEQRTVEFNLVTVLGRLFPVQRTEYQQKFLQQKSWLEMGELQKLASDNNPKVNLILQQRLDTLWRHYQTKDNLLACHQIIAPMVQLWQNYLAKPANFAKTTWSPFPFLEATEQEREPEEKPVVAVRLLLETLIQSKTTPVLNQSSWWAFLDLFLNKDYNYWAWYEIAPLLTLLPPQPKLLTALRKHYREQLSQLSGRQLFILALACQNRPLFHFLCRHMTFHFDLTDELDYQHNQRGFFFRLARLILQPTFTPADRQELFEFCFSTNWANAHLLTPTVELFVRPFFSNPPVDYTTFLISKLQQEIWSDFTDPNLETLFFQPQSAYLVEKTYEQIIRQQQTIFTTPTKKVKLYQFFTAWLRARSLAHASHFSSWFPQRYYL